MNLPPAVLIPVALGILFLIFRRALLADWEFLKSDRKLWLRDKWENWIKPLIIAAVLAVGIRTYFVGPYKIPTGSMIPTLMIGDRIFVDKITYRFREPHRGEIIVFRYPLDRKKDFVKRLVGFGGESLEIRDGQLYVNDRKLEEPALFSQRFYYNRDDWKYGKHYQKILIPEGYLFLLGDNSAASSDSRNWGFVPRKDVIGRVVLIWWPPQRIRLIKNP